MASLIMSFTFLAVLGALAGRLLGPPLKKCPYRLSGIMSAAFPTVAGLATIAFLPEVEALKCALTGIVAGMGACSGVFASGQRSLLLALLGAFVGAAVGSGLIALL